VPDAGDVVSLEFDPQAGHEQADRRPAVVLSPANYNGKTSLMICCPLTARIKGYPFEVILASQSGSTLLSDQVKNFVWRAHAGPSARARSLTQNCGRSGRNCAR
jgi:mRNA interferase MazF